MSAQRLKAELWIKAYMRRCYAAHRPAMLIHKGDEHGGSLLIKLNTLDGQAVVLSPSFGHDGGRVWLRATGDTPVEEHKADDYIVKRRKSDPDLWVVEVESADGNALLDEPIE